MELQEFIKKWIGKKCDFDGAYGGQCVDLFRMYLQEVLKVPQPNGVTGAADFWDKFESDPALYSKFDKIKNTPSGVPQAGDVIIWSKKAGKGYGHIAIFIEGDAKSFKSFDQNWPTLSKCTQTNHTYTNVLGWLRPNQPVISATTLAGEIKALLAKYGF